MGASLILVRGDGRQSEIPLKGKALIGRQTDCQIRIASSGISRHHCEVSMIGDKITVRDLGSSNGTFVNRSRVTQAEVAAGDLISLGDLVFVVRIDGVPETVDAEEAWDEGAVPVGAQGPAKPAGKPAPAKPSGAKNAAKPAEQAKKPGLLDDDAKGDSSVVEFDFLDEDDDIKNQPKL